MFVPAVCVYSGMHKKVIQRVGWVYNPTYFFCIFRNKIPLINELSGHPGIKIPAKSMRQSFSELS